MISECEKKNCVDAIELENKHNVIKQNIMKLTHQLQSMIKDDRMKIDNETNAVTKKKLTSEMKKKLNTIRKKLQVEHKNMIKLHKSKLSKSVTSCAYDKCYDKLKNDIRMQNVLLKFLCETINKDTNTKKKDKDVICTSAKKAEKLATDMQDGKTNKKSFIKQHDNVVSGMMKLTLMPPK